MFTLFLILILISDAFLYTIVVSGQIYKYSKKASIISEVCFVLLMVFMSIYNLFIASAFFTMISVLTLVVEIIRYLLNFKSRKFFPIVSLAVATVITVSYLGYSFYVANDLKTTNYCFDVGADLRIVQISDIHYGAFGNKEKLHEIVDLANEQEPDVIVLTGDVFDEYTSLEKMVEGCSILGELQSNYGVYYILGNHDYQAQYNNNGFTMDELSKQLEKNGITELMDRGVKIDDNFFLIGREDKTYNNGRLTLNQISTLSDYEEGQKIIVLDHQPNDFKGVEKTCDGDLCLVLSGHTHGGQMFPVNLFYRLFHYSDDLIYGTTTIGETNYVVSSGATGGGIPLKNCTVSEIVVIDLK